MKKIFTLLSILSGFAMTAQLYIAANPNSYVYVGDQYLFVKQDVNLQNNSNLYLRNGGQLLQGTTATSTNQGQGKLSVFQEGTVDNFEYNYWCSPVGNASAATGNEAFGVTMLNRPSSVTASTPATMLSMTALNGEASNPGLNIAPRWIFKFLSSSTYSQWVSVGAASTIGAGEGFTMKGTSGTDASFSEGGVSNNPGAAQRYDFRGKPNDGDISITVGAGKLTLTGNPYPSAIDLQAFLLAATNCTGVAYFWEQDKTVNSHLIASYQGGYGTYAAGTNTYTPPTFYAYNGAGTQLGVVGTGTNYPRKFSPVGQGFMIEGSVDGTVTMENVYRVFQKEGVISHFERPASAGHGAASPGLGDTNYPEIPSVSGFDYTQVSMLPNPQIRFNILLNNQGVRQLALTFNPLATDGIDRAMDAKSPGGGNTDGFFALESGEYVIAAIDFDINKKIPLGLKSDGQGTFRIRVAEMLNFTDAENVYVHDKLTDIYYDVKEADFDVTLPAGIETSRYEITFINSSLGVPGVDENAFDILQDNDAQQLVIANPDMLELNSCSLYDITGKLVMHKNKLGTEAEYRFSTSGLSEGIYIVKLLTDKGQSFSRKVSIFRKL
ncbi:Secretion system C-terminal sorting domain-containing protein [Flavobacterium longum]|uniref:T9SS sorting signal type C domain-containing protein n=1 Tax=Flavobacterium longum TaxID=1299340 RepID=UPI0039EB3168